MLPYRTSDAKVGPGGGGGGGGGGCVYGIEKNNRTLKFFEKKLSPENQ